jgi:FKBP-type peptidyl-prolyl cis-trans isomerase/cyclophilin family peptidyl-prolyl cis-trans isomerase
MQRRSLLVVAWCLVAPALAQQTGVATAPAAATAPVQSRPARDPLHPLVLLETTMGNIVVELDGEKAPISTQNFIRYVEEGFYDGLIFHRVIKDFMIQGGGFTPELEEKKQGLHPPIKNEWQNGLKNTRGTIAMARSTPDSATSQFFINVVDNPFLDTPRHDSAGYAVFGRVVEGMDVVDRIREVRTTRHPKLPTPDPQPTTPVEPVIIRSARLISDYDRAAVDRLAEEALRRDAEEKERAERQKQQQLEELIAKIEAQTGNKIQKTASGLMYAAITEGQGPSPGPSDIVSITFTATLLDGTQWEAVQDKEKPHRRRVKETLPGLAEGLQLMKVGGHYKFIVPPQLAYGSRGRPEKGIPPMATLVLDVELLGIESEAEQKAAQEKQLAEYLAKLEAETGQKVHKTPSGLMYVVLKEGDGPQPKSTDTVSVHYTGWLLDGTRFDSSLDRGTPFTFSLTGGVIRGWLEGVPLMKVGSRYKFVIPPALGYGSRGFPPTIPGDATLVFEIELLEIK